MGCKKNSELIADIVRAIDSREFDLLTIGRRLGSGKTGTVFDSIDGTVVKIGRVSVEHWIELQSTLAYFLEQRNEAVNTLVSYGKFCYDRPLSEGEDVFFWQRLEHLHSIKNSVEADIACACIEFVTGDNRAACEHPLWSDKRFVSFREHLKELPFVHTDVHRKNVMVNCAGDLKVIDLEAFRAI